MGREMPKNGERLRATADCQQIHAIAGFCKTAVGEAGMNLVCRQSLKEKALLLFIRKRFSALNPQGASKWVTGSGKVPTHRFLGVLSNFR